MEVIRTRTGMETEMNKTMTLISLDLRVYTKMDAPAVVRG